VYCLQPRRGLVDASKKLEQGKEGGIHRSANFYRGRKKLIDFIALLL